MHFLYEVVNIRGFKVAGQGVGMKQVNDFNTDFPNDIIKGSLLNIA